MENVTLQKCTDERFGGFKTMVCIAEAGILWVGCIRALRTGQQRDLERRPLVLLEWKCSCHWEAGILWVECIGAPWTGQQRD